MNNEAKKREIKKCNEILKNPLLRVVQREALVLYKKSLEENK